MTEYKKHLPGSPCWAELSTTDEKGALAFYSGLFGWKDDPQPMGPGQLYHMQQIRGLPVSALYQQMEEEKKQGVPSHWRVYFAVASADDAAARATKAGGKVVMPPFDVLDAGRMAVVQDPQGAFVSFWQAKKHVGYKLMQEPGAVVWNELRTTDSKKAAAFYKAVLPIDIGKMPGPMDYSIIKVGGQDMAGIMEITKDMGPMPPHWSVYFHVASVDQSAKKAASLKGKVPMPPQDIPTVGRFAIIQDPQGAFFGIFTPKP